MAVAEKARIRMVAVRGWLGGVAEAATECGTAALPAMVAVTAGEALPAMVAVTPEKALPALVAATTRKRCPRCCRHGPDQLSPAA